ncbi:MAG: S1 RNA-binding domain-containing protein [bacterium]|nr:S1 RNA-binding domain-containing protein [bacterium]
MSENMTMAELLATEEAKRPKRGDIVRAKVELIRDNQVVLEVPGFAGFDAYMFKDQYSDNPNESINDLKVGDEIDVAIAKINETEDSMSLLVSRLPLLKKKNQEVLLEKYNNKETISVKVTKLVNKGVVADYAGCEIFIPESLLSIGEEVNLNNFLGRTIDVKIVEKKTDFKGKEKYVASHKAVLLGEMLEKRKEEISNINVGDTVKATVINFEPYGILMQIGLARGILKYNQVSHFKDERAEKILAVGDELAVKVIAKDGNKIDLSRKALIPSPYQVYVSKNEVSKTVVGKVVQKIPAGLILELDKGVTGLLHRSEFSWNPNDNLDMCVKIGDEIEVKIIKLDDEKQRISLSRKLLLDNPWKNVDCKKDDILEVEVLEATSKGLKVLACGVEVMINPNDCLAEKGKLEDFYAKGDKVKAKVIDVNKDRWILKLNIKVLKIAEQQAEFEKYKESNDNTSATIGDIIGK